MREKVCVSEGEGENGKRIEAEWIDGDETIPPKLKLTPKCVKKIRKNWNKITDEAEGMHGNKKKHQQRNAVRTRDENGKK